MIPDSIITLPGLVSRLCRNQRELTTIANQIGGAVTKSDWLAIEGLADRVVELGNDLGMDAYHVDKAERKEGGAPLGAQG